MLGSLILYIKGMRILMFQLSGFYCKSCTLNPTGQSLRPVLKPHILNPQPYTRPKPQDLAVKAYNLRRPANIGG